MNELKHPVCGAPKGDRQESCHCSTGQAVGLRWAQELSPRGHHHKFHGGCRQSKVLTHEVGHVLSTWGSVLWSREGVCLGQKQRKEGRGMCGP